VRALARDLGIALPAVPDTQAIAAAVGAIAVTLLLGWLAGRALGPWLYRLWERYAGTRGDPLQARICAMIRYGVIGLGMAVTLRVQAWPPLAIWLFGLVGAGAAALLVKNVARGLNLARWIAWLLAAIAFTAVLADTVGGLSALSAELDKAGFTLGSRRFTLLGLVQILVGLLALYAVVRLASRLIGQSIRRSQAFDPTQKLLAEKLSTIAIIAIAFFVGIDLAGIDLTALAVFSGALGLAVGFGLQKTVGNLFAGIILLMDRSIKPGDVIVVGESFGSVNKIGVRAVSVITRDGKEHLIPNEDLMTREVENWSYSSPNVRIHIPVTVAYECDLPLAQKLMIEAAGSSKRVLASPRPNVWLRAFAENGVEHDVMVWIADPEAGVGNVQSEILNRLWELFKEHGIAVPYPQRDLHVKEWPPLSSPEGAKPRAG
jgi:small-conductance mechanosensitive channel